MTTLDTAYIRKSHRRRGLGLSILEDIVKTFPDEDIGLSTPVSMSMYHGKYAKARQCQTYKFNSWNLVFCSCSKVFEKESRIQNEIMGNFRGWFARQSKTHLLHFKKNLRRLKFFAFFAVMVAGNI